MYKYMCYNIIQMISIRAHFRVTDRNNYETESPLYTHTHAHSRTYSKSSRSRFRYENNRPRLPLISAAPLYVATIKVYTCIYVGNSQTHLRKQRQEDRAFIRDFFVWFLQKSSRLMPDQEHHIIIFFINRTVWSHTWLLGNYVITTLRSNVIIYTYM